MMINKLFAVLTALWLADTGLSNPPVASYMFPAGGQRGKAVDVRVGGLFLNETCGLDMDGPAVQATSRLHRIQTLWFEGPILPLPESQQAEDYPQDMAGRVHIASDALLGMRNWKLWTSQGATSSMKFVVGNLPEVVEEEIEGDPVPVEVNLPVTINGRIFPREDVDIWSFKARKGQIVSCEVCAARLGSPLDSQIEVIDPEGKRVAENDDALGSDSFLRFTAPTDGTYQVRIQDVNYRGGQAFVYRLTLTSDPYVDHVYPLGGQRGTTAAFQISGQGLSPTPVEIQLPKEAATPWVHCLRNGGKETNPFGINLDDVPEQLEAEPNDNLGLAKMVNLPAILNGRIDRAGDVDYWSFAAKKGASYEFEARAGRSTSPLDPVFTIHDQKGKELARSADPTLQQPDTFLKFTAIQDGILFLRVADRFRSHGGPSYAYRIRVERQVRPDFNLHLDADALTVVVGAPANLKVLAERKGDFKGPIQLMVLGLPSGVTVANPLIADQQAAIDLLFKTSPSTPIGVRHVKIVGTATIGGVPVTRTASLSASSGPKEENALLLAVAMPTPFKIVGKHEMRWTARGSVVTRHYHIDRGGFDGPIQVQVSDRQARHLQGARGPTIIVPAGATEFDYSTFLPPWMETGRTCRVVLMGTGTVRASDGSEHAVSYSSIEPNEQIIVVVEPGMLSIELDKSSLMAEGGKTGLIDVRISRNMSTQGPVKIELVVPSHIRGIRGHPIALPGNESRVSFPVSFAEKLSLPSMVTGTIRSTLIKNGQPIVAEAKVDFVPMR